MAEEGCGRLGRGVTDWLDLTVCGLALADKSTDDMARYTKLLEEKLLTVDLRDGLVDKADEEKRR